MLFLCQYTLFILFVYIILFGYHLVYVVYLAAFSFLRLTSTISLFFKFENNFEITFEQLTRYGVFEDDIVSSQAKKKKLNLFSLLILVFSNKSKLRQYSFEKDY